MRDRLPKDEFDWIFSRVPRLTVEVVISSADRGVLLSLRDIEPYIGLWHIPGGTVRFGEPVTDAVTRVAREELGLSTTVGPLLGYIEYPSLYETGAGSPVGLAFAAAIAGDGEPGDGCAWFKTPPGNIIAEQAQFLIAHGLLDAQPSPG